MIRDYKTTCISWSFTCCNGRLYAAGSGISESYINEIEFRSEEAPKIHIAAEKKASEWGFSIQDNGIRIDLKYSERIIEIFKRQHNREIYSGTWIELTSCETNVERYSGRIWVESELGKGSTFYFTLPINTA